MTSYCMSITVMLLANKLQSKINRTVCYKRRCTCHKIHQNLNISNRHRTEKKNFDTYSKLEKHSKYKKEVWRRKRLKWITIVVLKTS